MTGPASAPVPPGDLAGLPALALRDLLADGRASAEEAARACLGRIAAREPEVRAWAFLDPERAIEAARARDAERRAGRPLGPLHGVPVGVKDIVDTADMPTACGTPLLAGRQPAADAAAVARLRAAGAVVLGKTVTTELALYTPGPTRNPRDPGRTPGGSSSGSAAAVADGMAPLAIGSQTNGSVIRPAAYCGVVGVKPSHGLVPRTGVLALSRALDHLGVFARTLPDAALLLEALIGHDPGDPDTRPPRPAPRLLDAVREPWPLAPDLALVRGPAWGEATPALAAAWGELGAALGPRGTEVGLPPAFDGALAAHRRIMAADMAFNLRHLLGRGRGALSPRLLEVLDEGRGTPAPAYLEALEAAGSLRAALGPLFERHDAILTPSAAGEAPVGLDATGSPAFCTVWTLLGLPAVNLPLLEGPNGLPMGVQLVGAFGDDARLLRTAGWLLRHLGRGEGEGHA